MHPTPVGTDHRVWVQYCNEGVEVAVARGGKEASTIFLLVGEIRIGKCGRCPYSAADTAGELAGGAPIAVGRGGTAVARPVRQGQEEATP